MNNKDLTIQTDLLKEKIYTVRGKQVMLDCDLAEIYDVEVKRLNEQVKRNIDRFPSAFRFQLERKDIINLKSQFATSSLHLPEYEHGGKRSMSYVFTEQGVSMLSAVLRSKTAVTVSIQIMNAFVEMRKQISSFAGLFQRMDSIERKQLIADENFEKVFKALEDKNVKVKQGIFYNGQIFDAYCFLSDLIKTANTSIVVIDNYVDENVLIILSKRKPDVEAEIYTKKLSKQFTLDLKKHNEQYREITARQFASSHDRFLIIDQKEVYHFGASLKDLGKKWFAFSKLDIPVEDILLKLKHD